MIRFIIAFSFGLLTIFSCSSKQVKQPTESGHSAASAPAIQKENFPIDSVIRTISCTADPSQSFALYLPPSYTHTGKFPVIVFFDPHGNGSLPVSKYSALAKQFGFVMAGSNNSKNGKAVSETNDIVKILLSDLRSRIAVDEKRIVMAGFSGGAKVSLAYGQDHPEISAIIYAGAAIPIQHSNPSLSLLGFAGVNDMNYTDLIAFDQSVSLPNMHHFLIEWNGKHEWPSVSTFRDAFYWTAFNSMRNHLQDRDEILFHQFQEENEKAIRISNDPFTVFMLLNKARYFLSNISPTDSCNDRIAAIEKGKDFQEATQYKQQLIQQEQSLKQDYYAAFQQKDLEWWKLEITRIKNVQDAKLKPMYQRLLGFISLAGNSISTNAILQNQFETANKMLTIYKLADPENSDQPFLEACYFAKLNEPGKAISSLKEAMRLGMKDVSKIMNESALSTLHSMPEFISLVKNLTE
ncbi:MAG: hypothetical protein ABIO46_00250 [Chitinophagales bacterium]